MPPDGCRPIADDNDTSREPDILDIQINLPPIELLRVVARSPGGPRALLHFQRPQPRVRALSDHVKVMREGRIVEGRRRDHPRATAPSLLRRAVGSYSPLNMGIVGTIYQSSASSIRRWAARQLVCIAAERREPSMARPCDPHPILANIRARSLGAVTMAS